MANQVDQYGREILSEKLETGGVRYFDKDGSVCTALKPGNDAEALRIFNANPPPGIAVAEPVTEPDRVNPILDAMEDMTPEQLAKLARILSKVK